MNTPTPAAARQADLASLIVATIRVSGRFDRDDARREGFTDAEIDAWADQALSAALKADPGLADRLAEGSA